MKSSVESESEPPLHERVVALERDLAPAERTVARFLSDHPDLVAGSNAAELAQLIGCSNATVVRTVKALGYSGLPGLRRVLMQAMVDRRDPVQILTQSMERLENAETGGDDRGAAIIPGRVIQGAVELLQQARRLIDPIRWNQAVDIVSNARSVIVYGVEQAGVVADYFAIELSWSGRPARAVTATGISIADELITMSPEDAVIVVAPIRHFREVDTVIDYATDRGVPVILVSEALGMSLEGRVSVVLSTPQSTRGLTGEALVPLILARAFTLEVASRDPALAIATHQTITDVRTSVLGGAVDADLPDPPSVQALRRQGRKTGR